MFCCNSISSPGARQKNSAKWNKIERGMNKRLQVAQNDHAASGSCVSVNINLHQLIVMIAEGSMHTFTKVKVCIEPLTL